MHCNQKSTVLCVLIPVLAAWMLLAPASSVAQKKHPVPKAVPLDAGGRGYLRVLGGPPETSGMRSGLVLLAPGISVGKHNTEKYEEIIIVLSGQAEMRITHGETIALKGEQAAYCPAHTEHDVLNTGSDTLRYVYVVSEAKK